MCLKKKYRISLTQEFPEGNKKRALEAFIYAVKNGLFNRDKDIKITVVFYK